MNRIWIRTIAWLMCTCMLLGAAVACGGKDTVTDDAVATTSAAQEVEATTTAAVTEEVVITRENYPDSLPEDLRFDGKTFRFMVRGDSARTQKNGGSGIGIEGLLAKL